MTSTTTLTILKFTQESFLKQKPSEFVTQNDLDTGNAIKVMKRTILGVTDLKVEGTHLRIKLAFPISGITTWFVFRDHVDRLAGTLSTPNLNIVFLQDSFLKQKPSETVTQADLESRNAIKMIENIKITVSEFGAIDSTNKHRKIKSDPAIEGRVTWYVFAPHVAITS
jgi:hypothetical protein